MRRLTINSDLQIFFDDHDAAKYQSLKGNTLEAVQQELYEWQAFVETWLTEVVEKPKPERLILCNRSFKGS